MSNRGRATAVWPVLALLVAACSGVPPTHFYVLEPQDGVRATAGDGLRVGVRPFEVDPPYDQQRIAYRIGVGSPEIRFYAYHQWAAPPARLMAGRVAAGLAVAEGIGSIEPLRSAHEYDAVLEGRILALEEIDEPDGQHVRVTIALALHPRAAAGPVWSYRLEAQGVTTAREVGGVVEAMNEALERALADAARDLGAALRR